MPEKILIEFTKKMLHTVGEMRDEERGYDWRAGRIGMPKDSLHKAHSKDLIELAETVITRTIDSGYIILPEYLVHSTSGGISFPDIPTTENLETETSYHDLPGVQELRKLNDLLEDPRIFYAVAYKLNQTRELEVIRVEEVLKTFANGLERSVDE